MKKRNRKIERALRQRFPGWKGKFYIENNGDWYLETDRGSKEAFYDLYPTLTRAGADRQIVQDVMTIVNQHMPSATLAGYEQHGQYIRVKP